MAMWLSRKSCGSTAGRVVYWPILPIMSAVELSKLYTALFVRAKINDPADDADDFEIPTLHLILLHVEWFVSPNKLEAIAELIARTVRKRNVDRSANFLDAFNALSDNDSKFVEELTGLIGRELFEYAGSAISEGVVAIPLGLAPTFRVFESGCANCRTPKYIRSFCLSCGQVHEDSDDVRYLRISNRRARSDNNKTTSIAQSKANSSGNLKNLSEKLAAPSSSQNASTSSVSSTLTGALRHLNGFKTTGSPNSMTTSSTSSRSSAEPPLLPPPAMNGVLATPKYKVFSLQQLIEDRKKKELAALQAPIASPMSSASVVAPSTVEGVEIVMFKAQPVVVDLVSDDSDTETAPPARFTPPPQRNQASTAAPAPAQRSPTQPTILHFDPRARDALVPVKLEKCASQEFMSECNSTIDSGELDVDLAPVKLEWPAQRMDKYEMAAMRGIASLYKYGQSRVNPGDMLFLMRNLATNCSGLHRIAARCGFQKLCVQWATEHKERHATDTECDVADMMEGTFTLAQLINPANRSWAMYQETDNANADSNGHSGSAAPSSSYSSNSAGAETMWEDAEGKQESENDFSSRIDFALSCSNLRFMIYSLTGDRHYHSLQSEPGEQSGVTMELFGDTFVEAKRAKKQRTGSLMPVLPLAAQATNGLTRPIVPPKPFNYNSYVEPRLSRARSCNAARNTDLKKQEELAGEFGSLDKFGNVSGAVAAQFMEFAAVIASCKHYIKANFTDNVWDFIGTDLDKELAAQVPPGLKRKTSSKNNLQSAARGTASLVMGTTEASVDHNRNPHRGRIFTGALCWPYIVEEIGFDVDRRIDKSQLVGSEIRLTTLSKAISRLTSRRVYHSIGYFEVPGKKGVIDLEAYKQQCYFVTHVIYAFSDWGQHPLRRQLFIEEFKFMVSNASTVIEVLKDAELVGEFLHCLRVLQYTPERDPGLVELFEDGMDFLLRLEKHFGSMGRWVATRNIRKEDIYTQYHACYCAVVGLAGCAFAQDKELIFNPPVPRILHHLQTHEAEPYL